METNNFMGQIMYIVLGPVPTIVVQAKCAEPVIDSGFAGTPSFFCFFKLSDRCLGHFQSISFESVDLLQCSLKIYIFYTATQTTKTANNKNSKNSNEQLTKNRNNKHSKTETTNTAKQPKHENYNTLNQTQKNNADNNKTNITNKTKTNKH
jgi:hypothetical protein